MATYLRNSPLFQRLLGLLALLLLARLLTYAHHTDASTSATTPEASGHAHPQGLTSSDFDATPAMS
jgi:hypothetical protein